MPRRWGTSWWAGPGGSPLKCGQGGRALGSVKILLRALRGLVRRMLAR